ncbi:Pyrimidine pathway regulatory protein 1 [Pseudozyma hubeiensis]|nr:Pyrimidine pathway regulatory protein 1 [Pseudozyma hubeiensis]
MSTTNAGRNGESSMAASNAAGPSNPPATRPAKRKSDKSRASPSSSDAADTHGAKPLARAVLVCKRCRSKKIKCDQAFPACGSCVKAGEPCVGIDSATGREVSRSYIVDLEHQVAELRAQNAELERLLAQQPPARHTDTASSSLKRPLQHVKSEFPLDRSESAASPDSRPAKRAATSPRGEQEQSASGQLLPGLILGPAGVEVAASTANEDLKPNARPSLGRLHSHASGLSPARLLCQAIQHSAQAGLRIRDPGSASRPRKFGAQSLGEDLNKRGRSASSRDAAQHGGEARGGRDNVAARMEAMSPSPHSGTATPSDGKKNSPFDDGDPMQYATATETADITVPAPEQALKPSPLPAPFPPLSIARKLIDAYFERVNPQLPILDRASFMVRFERACNIGLERAKAKLSAEDRRDLRDDDDDRISIDMQPADGHLFHLVFAIAAAMGWTRSNWSAENHHEAAMHYLDPRRLTGAGQEGNVGAIMGRDALEQLQCLLLTALYSIMRPMKPGVWYCLGVALRLTTGIGLYSETPGVLDASNQAQDASENLIERKRRLFWCSYALDRQVCVHLGRPFGIADSDIKVNLPWVENQSEMVSLPMGEGGDCSVDEDGDSSTELARREAASTLAALQSSAHEEQGSLGQGFAITLPKPKDASRWVSLSFFRMRILQSEIQSILYQNAELPRRFDSYAHWKADILRRLHAWRRYAPSSKVDLEASGCGYNPIFLELNYQQTLLMVFGLSPRFPNASRKDLASVEECSRSIINMYATLSKEGQMNYTWMTGHNVFIACTSYLYAVWQISATDPASFRSSVTLGFRSKVDEIHHFAAACDKVLTSLQWATAEKCRKCLRTMFYATSVVVEKIDRMSSALSGNRGRSKASSDRRGINDQVVKEQSSRSSTNKAPLDSREAEAQNERTGSFLSSNRTEATPGIPASTRSLYSQERDWRQSTSNRSHDPSSTSPQSESLVQGSQWNQGVQLRSSPGSSVLWPTENELPNQHSLMDSNGRGMDHRAKFTSTPAEAYASDATTPSRGLDVGSAAVDSASNGTSWYAFSSETSPRMLFPDSPSNFDISSLMATSAMELDALFREAGLSTGPSSDQRGWPDNNASSHGHGAFQAPQYGHDGSAPNESASQWMQGEAAANLYGPVHQSVSSGAESKGKWALPSNSHASSEQIGAVGALAETEAFETDWEALGFGYRMSEPSQYSGPMPMFADQQGQQQQRREGLYQDGSNVQQAGRGAGTEFDTRFLDSHMGF